MAAMCKDNIRVVDFLLDYGDNDISCKRGDHQVDNSFLF